MTNVKVFVHQTDADVDTRAMTPAPRTYVLAGLKSWYSTEGLATRNTHVQYKCARVMSTLSLPSLETFNTDIPWPWVLRSCWLLRHHYLTQILHTPWVLRSCWLLLHHYLTQILHTPWFFRSCWLLLHHYLTQILHTSWVLRSCWILCHLYLTQILHTPWFFRSSVITIKHRYYTHLEF